MLQHMLAVCCQRASDRLRTPSVQVYVPYARRFYCEHAPRPYQHWTQAHAHTPTPDRVSASCDVLRGSTQGLGLPCTGTVSALALEMCGIFQTDQLDTGGMSCDSFSCVLAWWNHEHPSIWHTDIRFLVRVCLMYAALVAVYIL